MSRAYVLANAATTTGVKEVIAGPSDGTMDTDNRTFQVVGQTTAGAGSVTVAIEVSNNGVNYIALPSPITLTLSTAAATDGTVIQGAWAYVRANVTAISGTGASVSVIMGY